MRHFRLQFMTYNDRTTKEVRMYFLYENMNEILDKIHELAKSTFDYLPNVKYCNVYELTTQKDEQKFVAKIVKKVGGR